MPKVNSNNVPSDIRLLKNEILLSAERCPLTASCTMLDARLDEVRDNHDSIQFASLPVRILNITVPYVSISLIVTVT